MQLVVRRIGCKLVADRCAGIGFCTGAGILSTGNPVVADTENFGTVGTVAGTEAVAVAGVGKCTGAELALGRVRVLELVDGRLLPRICCNK